MKVAGWRASYVYYYYVSYIILDIGFGGLSAFFKPFPKVW